MRSKYIKSFVTTTCAVMVLGLAVLSFQREAVSDVSADQPVLYGPSNPFSSDLAEKAPDSSAAVSTTPVLLPTQALPTATLTPTPSPTPTPSLAQQNALLPIQPATDDVGIRLTGCVETYLKAYHEGDYNALASILALGDLPTQSNLRLHAEEVATFRNLTCYYKKGISYADYIVYFTYDIKYEGSNVFIPVIEECCISFDPNQESYTLSLSPQNSEVAEALSLSRVHGQVRDLYLQETIRCYMNAKLACDEKLLAELVIDSSYINMDDISKKTQYIEGYQNYSFIIRECPDTVTEFRYIVYSALDLKIVNIATLAPGADEFLITLDETNHPKIFFGVISEATDAFIKDSRKQEDFVNLYEDVINRMADAIISDSNLREFIERINNATGQ